MFYRNTHWNISQVMQESQRFLYDVRLYRAGALDMAALSLDYDLLWNRLDVFLISTETADARAGMGWGRCLNGSLTNSRGWIPRCSPGS
jgi:hypothetical protein